MRILTDRCYSLEFVLLIIAGTFVMPSTVQASRPVVPGTGTKIEYVGDDFEDASWDFVHNLPKSSREQDNQLRAPLGYSTNGRWVEGPERGQPDHIKVVPNPPGALLGSKHGLLLRTLNSGIPGRISNDVQQNDLVANVATRLGTSIQVSEIPSVVVRVYLPEADQWEKRTGPHFGFRISTTAITTEKSKNRFSSRTTTKNEPYWPGLWIHFRSKHSRGNDVDSAFLSYRGDRMGRDIRCLEIPEEQFGWWTMGMSVTPDGAIHYYAKPGVEDLTADDHITSQFPYSFNARQFRTYFFNVCNNNDGRSWSTPFIIDDPALYLVNSSRVDSIVQRRIENEQRTANRKNNQAANNSGNSRTRK